MSQDKQQNPQLFASYMKCDNKDLSKIPKL